MSVSCPAWFWKEYAHNLCLVGRFSLKHHGSVFNPSLLSLWTRCEGKLSFLFNHINTSKIQQYFCIYLLFHPPQVVFDRMKGMALILYNNIEYAQAAVKETKGWKIGGNKIKVNWN